MAQSKLWSNVEQGENKCIWTIDIWYKFRRKIVDYEIAMVHSSQNTGMKFDQKCPYHCNYEYSRIMHELHAHAQLFQSKLRSRSKQGKQ